MSDPMSSRIGLFTEISVNKSDPMSSQIVFIIVMSMSDDELSYWPYY